jgi:hypothetical protein
MAEVILQNRQEDELEGMDGMEDILLLEQDIGAGVRVLH